MNEENNDQPSSPIPWPKASDVLFKTGDDWWNNACLNYGSSAWELYTTGYKDAADILVERVSETNRHADFLIYPIVFLYRHHLELRLKQMIISGQALLDHKPDLQHIHKLDSLWNTCRKILAEVWPESPVEDLNAVEKSIHQLAHTDPQSMSFRYPVTKEGKPTLPNMQHINIRNLQEVMAGISSFLDGASTGIGVYLDHKLSMERDFYG